MSSPARRCSASHFREAAARSLLIPRAYPGKRTPLWQQRLKSQSLLEVARDFPRFPVVLETYRECLRDVLDLPSLTDLLRKLHSRELGLVEVETPTASPFASSLLFDYVATYMYEGDTPNAERRAAALALDRDLLRELLGQDELRELIDPAALEEVEAQLQHRIEAGRRRTATRCSRSSAASATSPPRSAPSGSRRATRPPRCWRSWSPSVAPRWSGSAARSATSRPRTPASTATRSGFPRLPACRRAFLEDHPDAMRRPGPPLCPHPRPLPDRPAGRPLRGRPDPGAARARAEGRPGPRRASARAAASASGATPTSCAGSGARASPTCGAKSSPPPVTASPASCPAGRTSTPTAPPAPAPTGFATRCCRCRAWP